MIRVGIVGAGFGTTGLLPAFSSIPEVLIVGHAKSRTEWHALIGRDDIDAVAIAVPPAAQHEIAKAAIERGLHVFAEKPLAASLEQARELLVLAQAQNIVHGIDFMFPDISAWKKVRELLESKTCGAFRHVSSRWEWLSGDIRYGRNTWRTDSREGGGAISFYFSHELYAIEQFVGRVHGIGGTLIHAAESKNGGEVGADLTLSFEGGETGDAHISCNSPDIRHEFTFTCENAVIELKNKNAIVDGFTVTVVMGGTREVLSIEPERVVEGEDERAKIVRKLARRFVAACANKSVMLPNFEDGVRVQEIVEKIRSLSETL